MTSDEYDRKREFLLEVLEDACTRGDYHLEHDVREQLVELQDKYYGDEE